MRSVAARELSLFIDKTKCGSGIITKEDLESYKVFLPRESVRRSYRADGGFSIGALSSRGTCLLELLSMLNQHGLHAFRPPHGFNVGFIEPRRVSGVESSLKKFDVIAELFARFFL